MTLRQFLGDLEKTEGTEAPVAPSADNKRAGSEVNKTLMGVAPAEIQELLAASKKAAMGTPPPEPDDSLAATSLDHKAPDMVPADPTPTAQGQPVPQAAQPAPVQMPPVQAAAPQAAAPQVAVPQAAAPQVAVPQATAPQVAAPQVATPQPAMAPATATVPATGKRKAGKSKAPPPKKEKGKFRETMWFKKGELDEAAAKAAAQSKPEESVSSKADEMEMDERYKDDGSITQQDQERLSLRTGATMMMEAVNQQDRAAHGGVSEADLVAEMTAGRNKILIAIGLAVVIVGGIIALVAS